MATVTINGARVTFATFSSTANRQWRRDGAGGTNYSSWITFSRTDRDYITPGLGDRVQFRDGSSGTPFPASGHVIASSGTATYSDAVPGRPTSFSVSAVGQRFRLQAMVDTSAADNIGVTKWQYKIATTSAGVASASWTDIASTSDDLDFTTGDIGYDTTRWFAVRAVNENGEGADTLSRGAMAEFNGPVLTYSGFNNGLDWRPRSGGAGVDLDQWRTDRGTSGTLNIGAGANIQLRNGASGNPFPPTFHRTTTSGEATYYEFSGDPVSATTGPSPDTQPPGVLSAETNAAGNQITITFNEALDTAHVPGAGDFSVSGTPTVSGVTVSGSTVVLALSGAYVHGDAVTVSYSLPSAANNRIQDAAGNEAAAFTNRAVGNNVPLALPGAVRNLGESAVTADSITWGFDAPDTGGTPASYEYRIATGNAAFSGSYTTIGSSRSFTVGSLSASTSYRVQVRARNATGAGADAEDSATTAAALPDASAPSVTINAVAAGDENTDVTLGATLSGGTYDGAVEYAWRVTGGLTAWGPGAADEVFSSTSGTRWDFNSATFPADWFSTASPDRTPVFLRIQATGEFWLHGIDFATKLTAFAESNLRITVRFGDRVATHVGFAESDRDTSNGRWVITPDDAAAWQAIYTAQRADNTNPDISIEFDGYGGDLDDSSAAAPEWTRPEVGANTDFDIDLDITVRGTGTNALSGTEDSATAPTVSATVRHVAPDTTAPAFSSAATNAAGTIVTITFDEALDTGHVPAPGAFNVQVAGSRRNVASSGVAVSGTTVALTLASAVDNGQIVTVAYTQPAAGQAATRLQDVAGNEVATFAAQAVTNNTLPDAVAPAVTINAVAAGDEGETVTLGATVTGGTRDALDYAWQVEDGTLDDATAANPVWTRPSVSADTDYDIDLTITARGTGTVARNGSSDSRAAATVSATVRNVNSWAVTLEAAWYVNPGTHERWEPPASSRPLIPAWLRNDPSQELYIGRILFANGRLVLHLTYSNTGSFSADAGADLTTSFENDGAVRFEAGDETLVVTPSDASTADTTEPYIWDFSGADATAINDFRGTLSATTGQQEATLTLWDGTGDDPFATAPTFVSAATNAAGTQIDITFSEDLDAGSISAATAFDVQVAGASRSVSSVARPSARVIRLTLASAITYGQTVTVAYTKPGTNPLQDDEGNEVESFAAQSVTNNVPPPLPGPARNLDETATTHNSITWGWDAPDTGGPAATYEYRTAQGNTAFAGNWTQTGNSGADRTVTVGSLSASTSYRIEVRARNVTGASTAVEDSATTTATPDTTAPALTGISTDASTGREITLTFDEALDQGHQPPSDAFTITVTGRANSFFPVTVEIFGVSVHLGIAEANAIRHGEAVTVGYNPQPVPVANRLQDPSGNQVATLRAEDVTNRVPAPPFTTLDLTLHHASGSVTADGWRSRTNVQAEGGVPAAYLRQSSAGNAKLTASGFDFGDGTGTTTWTLEVPQFTAFVEGLRWEIRASDGTVLHTIEDPPDYDSTNNYYQSLIRSPVLFNALTTEFDADRDLTLYIEEADIRIAGTGTTAIGGSAALTVTAPPDVRVAGIGTSAVDGAAQPPAVTEPPDIRIAGIGTTAIDGGAAPPTVTEPPDIRVTGVGTTAIDGTAALTVNPLSRLFPHEGTLVRDGNWWNEDPGTIPAAVTTVASGTQTLNVRTGGSSGNRLLRVRLSGGSTVGFSDPVENVLRIALWDGSSADDDEFLIDVPIAGDPDGATPYNVPISASRYSAMQGAGNTLYYRLHIAPDVRIAGIGTSPVDVAARLTVDRVPDIRVTGIGTSQVDGSAALTVTRHGAPDIRITGIGTSPVAGSATLTVRGPMPLTPDQAEAYGTAHNRDLTRDSDLFALVITHPDIDDPIRVVADNLDVTIDGNTFTALAFRAAPPNFQEGETPRAVLEIDNVGRELTQWIETTGGGRGAMMEVMQVVRDPQVPTVGHIVWSLPALPVGVTEVTNEVVQVALAYRTGRSRPGIKWRHDYETSPGVFTG